MAHELVQFFEHSHLPPALQSIVKKFQDVVLFADSAAGPYCVTTVLPELENVATYVKTLPENVESHHAWLKIRQVQSGVRGYNNVGGALSKNNAFRLLLEAKDCAVRAKLYKKPQ